MNFLIKFFQEFFHRKEPEMKKVLFILKRREDYSCNIKNCEARQVATGMYNSAKFVSDMLKRNGIESKVVVVVDNNCIDRECHKFKPTHVFIEGYWVVPEKFNVLKPLHPKIKWFIRCHSEMPFLAMEGIAVDWTFKYFDRDIGVSGNSPRNNEELRLLARSYGKTEDWINKKIPLLPNYYPENIEFKFKHLFDKDKTTIDVACFGAIRPLKNQFMQAVASIKYAEKHNKKLRFHINEGRVELFGQNALKNLKSLFDNLSQHELIEHSWASHNDFLNVIKHMDVCLQVSFTETFNIVSADAVAVGVPIVVSDEVFWSDPGLWASPNNSDDIVNKIENALAFKHYYVNSNKLKLVQYVNNSERLWVDYIHKY